MFFRLVYDTPESNSTLLNTVLVIHLIILIIYSVSIRSSFNSTLLKRIQLNSWIRINNQSRKMQFYWVELFRLLYSTSLKLYNWILKFNCWYSIVQFYSTKSKDEQVEENSLNLWYNDRYSNCSMNSLKLFDFVEWRRAIKVIQWYNDRNCDQRNQSWIGLSHWFQLRWIQPNNQSWIGLSIRFQLFIFQFNSVEKNTIEQLNTKK